MKKILFLLALAVPVSVYAQGLTAREVLEIRALKFTHEDDNAVVQLALDVDGRSVGTKERWEITPVIEAGAEAEELPPIVVSGRSRANMFRRARKLGHSTVDYGVPNALMNETVRRGEGRSVVYNITLPWQSWMSGASLNLYPRLITCCNDLELDKEQLAVLTAPAMLETRVPRVSYIEPVREKEKMRAIVKTARIDFHVNRSIIVPSLNRNTAELATIEATIDEVRNHSDLTFRSIELTGYASPEGPYDNNDRLAAARVKAVMNYVAENYGVAPHNISMRHVAEDWSGLRYAAEHSTLRDKAAVLNIIDSYGDADAREAALKALDGGDPWRIILHDMMPPLRRTEYRVDYVVRDFDLDDSRRVLHTNPEHLSHYELYRLSCAYTPASDEYEQIYRIIEAQNPDDDVAHINVAAGYILRDNPQAAAAALERVKQRNAAYWNNYGIVLMMTGDSAAAAEAFRKSGTADAEYNLKLL